MRDFASEDHKAAARCLGYALHAEGYEAWASFSAILERRLSAGERAALAWAALRSLGHDDAVSVVDTVLPHAGFPLPTLDDHLEAATSWASWASPVEREAYALASFEALAPARRAAFSSFVQERVA